MLKFILLNKLSKHINMTEILWHAKSARDAIEELKSDEHGLEQKEAERRLRHIGENKLPEAKIDSFFAIFLRQFQSPLIYILMAAAVVVFLMNEIFDGIVIMAVLLFNAIIGAMQEGKARNALMALKKFTDTKAAVLRGGKEIIVPDFEIVPGDIIILQEGEKVPADARVISANNLKIDEAALTGESHPVIKTQDILPPDCAQTDRKNIVFKGTHIVAGNGKAVIFATGKDTFIGNIAQKIEIIDTEIPLKKNTRDLSRLIIIAVAAVSAIIFIIGIAAGKSAREMFGIVVSLAVSIVPEGLPVVVTLILAMGVWRMGKQKALVKRLQAVEALGQARVIAVDKTGTITKNELVVTKVYTEGNMFEIQGDGYTPKGAVQKNGKEINAARHPEIMFAGKIGAYCGGARLMFSEEENRWRVAGDPTEAALIVLGQKLGFLKENIEIENSMIAEIPFDSNLKYRAVIHKENNKKILAVIGAPEVILKLSAKIRVNGKTGLMSAKKRQELEEIFTSMSQEGLRVIAFASAAAPKKLTPESVKGLAFAGFYGMQDAIRTEAAGAMRKAAAAGIKVVMITGDHKITAQAIAQEAQIYHPGDEILTGEEIDKLSDEALSEKVGTVTVFARVNPDHKLRIVNAFRARGEIVAMTGDGVNDAPSLVAADLGVAMGGIGTEVAKEASDIILLDDNFENIVTAVEEGRSIYKNIKKVILYLFSTNIGEVLAIMGALILGYPLPILAAQIIWLNFITDGFLTVALAMEPKEKGLLKGNFEKPKKYLVDKLIAQRIFLMSATMAIATLYLFKDHYGQDMAKAWTISLTALAAMQWYNAWNCRSETKSIFRMNPFANKFLIGATVTVVLLQLLAVYNPIMQKLLRTAPLDIKDWIEILFVSASIIVVEEIRKFFHRKKLRKPVKLAPVPRR